VRTTAYTHTEDDHVAYGNRNALGGTLRAAPPPLVAQAAPVVPVATHVGIPNVGGGYQRLALPIDPAALPPEFANPPPSPEAYGSAAADWSRWPAGTVFRLLSTGQIYRVDDYGWALAGRNTIDLYLPTRAAMNAWSVRREAIQVLRWGDPGESLRLLRPRQKFRHIRRMVLELEGRTREAAALQ
jgi:3D (Asp-Asp-Asp) domain-containing protein